MSATATEPVKTEAKKNTPPTASATVPSAPLPQAQSAKVREMQLMNEQAERQARRRLAPDVSEGDSSVYDQDKAIEAFYKERGVIPQDGYLYIGSNKTRSERMISNGYRRLFDPQTGDPVNTEHGDPCYWREQALQQRHIQRGVKKDRDRVKAMDKSGGRHEMGPQADDTRIALQNEQSETVVAGSREDAERYVNNG